MLIFLPSTYLHIRKISVVGALTGKNYSIEFRRVGTMRMVGKKEHLKLLNGVKGVGYCNAGGGILRIAKLPILLTQ